MFIRRLSQARNATKHAEEELLKKSHSVVMANGKCELLEAELEKIKKEHAGREDA